MHSTFSTLSRVRHTPRRLGLMLAGLAVAVVPALAGPALPALANGPFTVNTFSDDAGGGACAGAPGDCSLRSALNKASGATIINLAAGTYTVSGPALPVGKNAGDAITIHGAGSASTIIKKTTIPDSVLLLDPNFNGNVAVTLQGLEVTGGSASGFGGGGIQGGGCTSSATSCDSLSLSDVVVDYNTTTGHANGGGISFTGGGNLTITNSTISHNSTDAAGGDGGGIEYNTTTNPGQLTISNSVISNNTAAGVAGAGQGGGIYLKQSVGTASIQSTVFRGNTAQKVAADATTGEGGAIFVALGALNAHSNVFVGNTAGNHGGAIFNAAATVAALQSWWGCQTGPNTPGCDTTSGTVATSPFAVITIGASPGSVNPGGTSAVTADMNHDSASAVITPVLPGEFSVTFGGTLGTPNPTTATTVNRVAQTTWTAGSTPGAGTATATIDNGTASAPITVLAPQADLKVTKTGPATAIAASTITYNLGVSNLGPNDAQAVALTDTLPAGTSFVSLTQTGGSTPFTCGSSGATVTCTAATLTNGSAVTFDLVAKVGAGVANGSSVTNTATVTSASTDPTPSNNTASSTTTVSTQADLAVTKAGPASVVAGDDIPYAITLTNNGPSDASHVSLTDPLPAGTTFGSFTQSAGPSFTCSSTAGTVTCTTDSLATGASASFLLTVHTSPTAQDGSTIANTASVASLTVDPVPANNTATASTTIVATGGCTTPPCGGGGGPGPGATPELDSLLLFGSGAGGLAAYLRLRFTRRRKRED
jgi:uncharacterized repeat protein (TIGR01451 family)